MPLIDPYADDGTLDASLLATADSYVPLEDKGSLQGFKAYAAAMGIFLNLPNGNAAGDTDLEYAARRGTILIDGMEPRFTGIRSSGDNALAWPRTGATRRDGSSITDATIPKAVRDATCWAASYALANPNDINQVLQEHRVIKKEKLGSLEREYADLEDVQSFTRVLTMVNDVLAGLLKPSDAEIARQETATAFLVAGRKS